jgi:hypothetical protein
VAAAPWPATAVRVWACRRVCALARGPKVKELNISKKYCNILQIVDEK